MNAQQPLQAPVVSCPLGKLYNKEALIAYLLSPPSATNSSPFGNDGHLVAGHIRSLKDVTTLHLTPNPTLLSQSIQEIESSSHLGTQESRPTALFVCPISLREMNGSVKFVYRKPCGCVLSESSLKEMRRAEGGDDTAVCPVTGKRDDEAEEWFTINPKEDELELLVEAFEARKVREKDEKKAAKDRKRKAVASGEMPPPPVAKKVKAAGSAAASSVLPPPPLPSVNAGASVPRLSATLAAKLAEQKKTNSPAIASLYAPKDADQNHVRLHSLAATGLSARSEEHTSELQSQ